MIQIGQLVNPNHYTSFDTCKGSKFWQRDASSVTARDLTILFYKIKQSKGYECAARAAEFLRDRILDAQQKNMITEAKMTTFNITPEKITARDFINWLEALSVPRRRCMLFAMMANMRIKDAADLSWKDLEKLHASYKISNEALRVAKLVPRHLQTNRVFWEQGETRPTPLIGLAQQVKLITGMGWKQAIVAFREMVLYDPYSAAQELNIKLS